MTLAASGGESLTLNLGGTVSGSVLAIDNATSGGTAISPTTSALLSGYTPSAVAVDGAGNIYEASGNNLLELLVTSPSSTVTLEGGLSAAPTQMAVDQTGNIFYLNGSSSIQKMAVSQASSPSTYSSATISYTPASLGTASPSAIAVDAAGNLFVADEQSSVGTIYRLSSSALSANSQAECSYPATASSPVLPSLCQTTIGSVGAFGSISSLVVDPSGNVYVADTTNSAVYKLTPDATGMYAQSTVSNVVPGPLAVDAAGDLYVQSGTKVIEYPVSGVTSGVTVLSGVTTPVGLAVDGLGNAYSADASKTYLTQVKRNSLTEDFGSSYTTEFTATLTNVGNQSSSAQSSANGAEAGDFTLAGCTFSNNLLASMTAGEACAMTAYFPAIGNTEDYDYIAFTPTSPSVSAPGQLTLKGQADMTGYDTTTAIGTASTSSPAYVASGTEVSFPITVTASSISTDGTVTNNTVGPTTANYVVVSVDSGAATTYNLTSASGLSANVTLNLSGLTAGTHSFTVAFPQQNSFLASSATSSTITVAQASASIAWSPSATSQYVSAAIGADVLNATVAGGIAGNVIYSVTSQPSCTSTSTATVDASTYLAVGSYTLYATFCPTDSTDYSGSTASISYTVNGSAPTTATVGASTMVVAADSNSGNYTSLTKALEALPVTGGTIYIKPGNYSGQNVISYPNVLLRGLGGDPTQVILSGENGAFSTSSFTASSLPTGFSFGPAGKGGDEGSATLDVSKNTYQGHTSLSGTFIPNNFYAEYLTIQNTYNTDPYTTSTEYASSNGGTCSSGGTATSLQNLYNNNLECGSQALALWITADQAVLNNVNLVSQQDTLYAGTQGCGTYCISARQYLWKGLITGDVDYVFGDAALVFDHTNFFTTWHGLTATGTETIEAQNKRFATGTTSTTNSSYATSSDYLSGFVCNGCTLLSQSTGMSKLYYGRPYNVSSSTYPASYSTFILLNSQVDQVNTQGWVGWDGASQYLTTSTYGEFNTQAYADPTPGTAPYPYALFNSATTGTVPSILYAYNASDLVSSSAYYYGNATAGFNLAGGNTGSGATSFSSRETNALYLTAATAAPYYPVDFLSTTVPSTKLSSGQSSTWNPVNALAAEVNAFAPVSSVGALAQGSSVTILGRPQTPGAGVIPTGTYAFYDSLGQQQLHAARQRHAG
jgi:pectin methylesterase-like acyl-CoA thioesterase